MRKLLLVSLVFALVSCAPIIEKPKPDYYVYNSAWELVDFGYDVTSRALDLSTQATVDEYNATHTDDQLIVMSEETPIVLAPDADAYIVDSVTHEQIRAYLDVPRTDLQERRELYRFQAYSDGGVLYIDNVPPIPEPPVPLPDYERYAVYIIGPAGIVYETHNEGWAAGGFASIEASYTYYVALYRAEAYNRGEGYFAHYGSLYTP